MLGYIIPPIVIIISLAVLILFLFKKSAGIPEEEIQKENRTVTLRENFNKKKIFRLTQLFLRLTEKGIQYFKLISLKLYNKADSWFHSIKEKREKRSEDRREFEKIETITEETFIIEKKEDGIVRRNVILTEEIKEKEVRPMISREVVHPDSKAELKNEFEKALIERIALNPHDVEAYERLGDYYIEVENFNDALSCFEQVLRLSSINRRAKIKIKRLQKIVFDSLGK